MNEDNDMLPAVAVAGGLAPWVSDLLEQYEVPRESGEEFVGFATFAIERFGVQSKDVLDSALMLVFEHGADLGIIGSLLDIKFGMYEIQVCYEAAVALDIQDIETIKKLIRFRRRFTDTQQSEDLAELIREALSGYIQSSSSKSPQDSTWKVPGFIDLVLDFASGIGGNNFAQVCQLLSGDKE